VLLSDVFEKQSIKPNLEAVTKEGVFAELIETIAGGHPELDRAGMISAIQVRESKMNTSVAPGVAVPHGCCPGTDKIIGALGISKTGIDYGAPDRNPVHFVFLLLMGESAREKHLRILNRVLALINSGALNYMRAASDPEEVYEILSRFR
jgi:mannitol/fructose-specific phosphotransferase system IIA component (Ntr-type)